MLDRWTSPFRDRSVSVFYGIINIVFRYNNCSLAKPGCGKRVSDIEIASNLCGVIPQLVSCISPVHDMNPLPTGIYSMYHSSSISFRGKTVIKPKVLLYCRIFKYIDFRTMQIKVTIINLNFLWNWLYITFNIAYWLDYIDILQRLPVINTS